jgi:hypothetical protein
MHVGIISVVLMDSSQRKPHPDTWFRPGAVLTITAFTGSGCGTAEE